QDVAEVLKRLREFRRDGVAVARGEVTPGGVGGGAPVFDGSTVPVACLTLTIRDSRVDDVQLARLKRDVRGAAAELSDTLAKRRGANISRAIRQPKAKTGTR